MLIDCYAQEVPALLETLASVPEMRRIAGVGMHCGCEHAAFPAYREMRGSYTRHVHSVGVARIVWHFTGDLTQAVAGLLHDISTPAFAHTVDFLNNDHDKQESTEGATRAVIEGSAEIAALLERHRIPVEEVVDYHRYPIADNNTPRLSADRLEYTFGTAYNMGYADLPEIRRIYGDLHVAKNESGEDELCFASLPAARAFTELSLTNSRLFVSDADRFAMQRLADLLRDALAGGALSPDDLCTTDAQVIAKLRADPAVSQQWANYARLSAVAASQEPPPGRYSVNVSAKRRYINPLVDCGGDIRRISDADAKMREKIESFLGLDFGAWLSEEVSLPRRDR